MNYTARLPIAFGLTTLAAVALALVGTPSASAQDNSLFRRGPRVQPAQREVPTSQPAESKPVTVIGAPIVHVRESAEDEVLDPKPNSVLLAMSPYAVRLPEPEQIRINDLVTIIVRVSKTAKSDSKMESKKEWTNEWALEKWIRLSDRHGIVPALFTQGKPAVEFEYSDEYGGDGKYDRKDSLTTRVQARVIDVKPNGNLVLEARNDVSFGEEDYTVTLTGTCRSEDVTPQNTVLSSQIADLDLRVDDRGALRDATRRGWLKRTLDILRPF